MNEPIIAINGVVLSKAEAMTIRVAVGNFALDLNNGLGDDETGIAITQGYKNQIRKINVLMYKGKESKNAGIQTK